MMNLDYAVDLVLHAFNAGNNGDIFIQKAPASTIDNLINALLKVRNKQGHEIKEIGIRHGEKINEVLCSREEMMVDLDEDQYFRIPVDKRDLNYEKYFEVGQKFSESIQDYRSDNTTLLDLEGMIKLLLKLPEFQNED